jgi:hypothetical protein
LRRPVKTTALPLQRSAPVAARSRNRNRNRAHDDDGERQARGLIRRRAGCQIKRDGRRPTGRARPGRRRVAGITSAARHCAAPPYPGRCREEDGHFADRENTRRRRRIAVPSVVRACPPLPPTGLCHAQAEPRPRFCSGRQCESDGGRSPPSPPVPAGPVCAARPFDGRRGYWLAPRSRHGGCMEMCSSDRRHVTGTHRGSRYSIVQGTDLPQAGVFRPGAARASGQRAYSTHRLCNQRSIRRRGVVRLDGNLELAWVRDGVHGPAGQGCSEPAYFCLSSTTFVYVR